MKVVHQGVPGAFSHEACLAFLPGHEPVGVPSFARVFEAVERGEADCGLLPWANNNAGPVLEVHERLASLGSPILQRHELPVRLHLMTLPGVELASVTTAVSHPMALKQCAASLERLGLLPEAASNTAAAAQSLADPTKAALASEAAARAYGLAILEADLQDNPDNRTMFIVIGRTR